MNSFFVKYLSFKETIKKIESVSKNYVRMLVLFDLRIKDVVDLICRYNNDDKHITESIFLRKEEPVNVGQRIKRDMKKQLRKEKREMENVNK